MSYSSECEVIVKPTRVRLLCPNKKSGWKIHPDYDRPGTTAGLTRSGNNQNEIKIYDHLDLDPVLSIDLKKVKEWVIIRGKALIELTQNDGSRCALEFAESDQNFESFYQRLISLIKLSGVKCSMKGAAKGILSSATSFDSSTAQTQQRTDTSAEGSTGWNLGNVHNRPLPTPPTGEWPTTRPPPPPSHPPTPPPPPSKTGSGVFSDVGGGDGNTLTNGRRNDSRESRRSDSLGSCSISSYHTASSSDYLTPMRQSVAPSLSSDSFNARRDVANWMESNASALQLPARAPKVDPTPEVGCSNCLTSNFEISLTLKCKMCSRVEPTESETRCIKRCGVTDLPAAKSARGGVDKRWRCKPCTHFNPGDAFSCGGCRRYRDDAWQCQVCEDIIDNGVFSCRRCDVWRCRLCSFQNDMGQSKSRICGLCGQITND